MGPRPLLDVHADRAWFCVDRVPISSHRASDFVDRALNPVDCASIRVHRALAPHRPGQTGAGRRAAPQRTLVAVSEERKPQVGMGSLLASIGLYTLARLVLVVVVAAIIIGIGKLAGVNVPLLVAAVFGVLIALPLGMVVFKSLRTRVNTQISAVDEQRRKRHDELQSKLRGS
ncbi:hypothetical protein GOPIP_088_00480 [Gordonia polyisoprenivorans NBRC 16320 = JCM 10675]|uniref:DUF4229 domain-containing protein n=2 Tax=Gordoniaceae TaxID=85026 RepID=A0A846WGZ7_9ACTN|nr:DUF4229 domain-containing protein [Gordonia polyisoprenivorans]GAB25938.1 hypothetical protein GOPIP_088_00480 [Gordonia polyisoprenivorans NBRC 16320 = JCM 10675]